MSVLVQIVVAMARNNVIGREGDMPWHIPSDLARFKALTMGAPMVMGRKTFESIGKALPGRTSIVVTRQKGWIAEGAVVVHDLDLAIAMAKQIAQDTATGEAKISIVGGGEIYALAMKYADELHITMVEAEPEGDTRFPEIDSSQWTLMQDEPDLGSEKDTAATRYRIYRRMAA